MKAVILAGGLGTRISEETHLKPKPMVEMIPASARYIQVGAFQDGENALIVLRALSGFCFAGAAMIVESWLNEVAENKSRGTIFSIYVTINMAASTLGQVAMSVTGTAGYVPFVIGAIAFACAVLPTALTSSPQPRP